MVLYSVLSCSTTEECFCLISFCDLISFNLYFSIHRRGYHCCLNISMLKCCRVNFRRLPNYVDFCRSADLEGWFKLFDTLLVSPVSRNPFAFLHVLLQHLTLLLFIFFFSSPSKSLQSSAICTVLHMNILMNISKTFCIQPHEIKKHLF